MATYFQITGNRPGYWRAFGHSYIENQLGTADQTGRPDGVFRDLLSIQFNEWANWAVTGSRVMQQGVSQGGYARMFQAVPGTTRGAPYVSNGGATLLCWGLNDLGKSGTGTTYLNAFIDSMRACISRARMAAIRENDHASMTWGAGFVLSSASGEWTSGSTYRTATATTNANFTITLPADYDGSTVVICYNGIVNGGSITYSGTAGVTGTFSTSNIIPAGEFSHAPRVHRIKTLTAANANQTIIGTVTAIDASGSVDVDCWWIESTNPPPVVVCDIAKLNSLGYSGFTQLSGNTVAANDAHIDTWNDALYRLVAEFDNMVQIAYCDDAISKNADLLWSVDGVHPNEFGSAALAEAIADAARRLGPPAGARYSTTAHINSPSPRGGQLIRSHRPATWYTAEFAQIGTAYTFVIGDMFCMPFQVTNPRMRIRQFSMNITTASATTPATIKWGLYDDPGSSGYPFGLMTELTVGSTFSVGTTTGVKTSPLPNAAGSIDKPLDPGLFWLCFKVVTLGSVTAACTTLAGKNLLMQNATTAGGPLATTGGYMGYKLTGQGTGDLPSRYPTTGALTDNVPFIGFLTT